MLQNIRIAVGPMPPDTGNLQEDHRNLRSFLENLLRAIETNFDALDGEIAKLSKEEKK